MSKGRGGRIDRGTGETILVSANSSWNIVNFRSSLVRGLIARGYRVVVAAPSDAHSPRIAELGAEYRPIALSSSGRSPITDARSLLDYYRLLRDVRPAAFLGFTAKPNIYGGLAGRALGIPVINNVSGLGAAFARRGALQSVVSLLYRAALGSASTIFFQNPDDRALFESRGLVDRSRVRLLPGSGIETERFTPPGGPRPPGPLRFVMVARMLWDKGVGEYVAAARLLRGEGCDAEFALLGPAGVDNRGAIGRDQLEQWDAEGAIRYLGESDDVRPHLARADCVVLPSYYREGVPRSLLEAAAMGRPIITTREIGCREAVDDGVSGLLIEARSADALADAMRQMLKMAQETRLEMGRQARHKAVREFDQSLVMRAYLEALDRLRQTAR